MKTMTRILVSALFLLGLAGCASTFKGIEVEGGAEYLRGELRGLLGAPLPEVEDAAKEVMEELDFVAISVLSDKLRGEVKAQMADGTKVKIKLDAEDFESTQLKIHVGSFGNQAVSRQIYKHIRRELKLDS